ncbi:Leucine Rich repeat [Novymonas esmeraldas]|uniref:Leucine Rich repeat n=1 Tax=Novymonas esmeraldas TaxID=1808958 RepID=A0AAW0F1L6_9TRYP
MAVLSQAAASRASARPRRGLARLACVAAVVAAALCLCCSGVRALEVGKFAPGTKDMSPEQRTASVQIVEALQRAIQDPDMQREAEAALKNTGAGFDVCHSTLLRCNSTTKAVEEVVIKDMRGGVVQWNELPSTVLRVFVMDSKLDQPLVLSSLPPQLSEFAATNVEWQSNALLQNPPGDNAPDAEATSAKLHLLQCNNCGLEKAELLPTSPQLGSLHTLSLRENPKLAVDISQLPRSLVSLQLSGSGLTQTTVKAALEAAPASLSRLNISFTGIAMSIDMLSSASKDLEALDVSGLTSGSVDTPLSVAQLEEACNPTGFNPTELYMIKSKLTGTLPALSKCTKLTALDMSNNKLSGAALDHLPPTLELLHLNNNDINSNLRTDTLPRALRSLDISANHFMGDMNLSGLPQKLQFFDISHNDFSGKVNLTQLPESIKFVYIQHNNFTGEADLVDIPLGIRFIMIHHNNWDYRLPAL